MACAKVPLPPWWWPQSIINQSHVSGSEEKKKLPALLLHGGLKSLRKVEQHHIRDLSTPNLKLGDVADTTKTQKQYRECVLNANIETWLPLLGHHTFYTQMLPISKEDGQLFIECYHAYEKAERQQQRNPLPAELADRAKRMESKLQRVIEQVRGGDASQPVFVKASSRSPKDAPAGEARLREEYLRLLSRLRSPRDMNARIICMHQAGLACLKIYSAAQATDLFLRSERICADMNLAMQHERWEENWIVRKWTDIDVGLEFRGFVHDGQLTALSQYNYLCYFPYVHRQQARISHTLQAYFQEHIRARLRTLGSYVVDFALVAKEAAAAASHPLSAPAGNLAQSGSVPCANHAAAPKNLTPMVIELNPFLESTDGCMFSWQRERQLLEQGPFTVRVRETAPKGCRALVSNDWRPLLDLEQNEQDIFLRAVKTTAIGPRFLPQKRADVPKSKACTSIVLFACNQAGVILAYLDP
eukprot:g61255.t1